MCAHRRTPAGRDALQRSGHGAAKSGGKGGRCPDPVRLLRGMIQLRSFQARDLAALHQLDQVCFPPEIAYSKAELQYFLTHPSCSCWIAEQPENKLAGFVIIERASRNGRPAGTSSPWMWTRPSAAAAWARC